MNLFKNIFGKKDIREETRPQQRNIASHKGQPELVMQKDGEPQIQIDTQAITHAFIALTHDELNRSNEAAKHIADLNRHCQPKVWGVPFKAKFVSFTANASKNGYPDVYSVPAALKNVGMPDLSSVVINMMEISLDGGKTRSKIYAGFSYRDQKPKIILPYSGGCIPL